MDQEKRISPYTGEYSISMQNEDLLSGKIIGVDILSEMYLKRKAKKIQTLCSSFTLCITVLCFYHQIKEISDYSNFVREPTFLLRVIMFH